MLNRILKNFGAEFGVDKGSTIRVLRDEISRISDDKDVRNSYFLKKSPFY